MFIQMLNEIVGAIGQLVIFCLIPFIWWLISGKQKESFLKWLGINKIHFDQKPIVIIVTTLFVITIYCLSILYCINNISNDITLAGSNFKGMGMYGIVAAVFYGFIRTGLSEEIIFRGFILKRLQNKFGFFIANSIQALLFGLLHGLPFGLMTQNIVVIIVLTILPGLFGFYEGYVNEKWCNGSIIPSWLLHGTMNFVVTVLSL